jgi:putative NIF3 family GTP cyclohydrolase 1 type 2
MKREELSRYLDKLLEAGRFRDYCPNGLQVEGRPEVQRLLAGVTANQSLLDVAVARGADAVLVHHGWFWRGDDLRVTGLRKTRLQTLLRHDINLIAYHLPLDAIPSSAITRSWANDSAGLPTTTSANRNSAGWDTWKTRAAFRPSPIASAASCNASRWSSPATDAW